MKFWFVRLGRHIERKKVNLDNIQTLANDLKVNLFLKRNRVLISPEVE